jgi:hypothetical protein
VPTDGFPRYEPDETAAGDMDAYAESIGVCFASKDDGAYLDDNPEYM